MKYFIIEGCLQNTAKMNDCIMQEHMSYTQKAMEEGIIFMSGLKSDMSGGIFIMKAESIDKIKHYLINEPFKIHGIQDYKIIEFNPHYVHSSTYSWFPK